MPAEQRRKLTPADHTAMIDAFRADAPHYRPAVVARECGVDPKTAHRAWNRGWERRGWAPICETLETEKQAARALLMERRAAELAAQDAQRDAAQADAAAQVADEAEMVRVAQASASAGLGAVAAISTQARQLGELVAAQIEADCTRNDDDAFKLSAAQGLALLDRVAKVTKTLLENGRQSMEMERLRLGRPTDVPTGGELGELTVDEADARIAAATQAIEAAKAGPGLHVVDGGQAEPSIGKRVELV